MPVPISIPPLVFAMTFAAPELLAGLLLVGVPILLHWLYRRPIHEEPWAAMEILRRALARRSQRIRLQTWLLLAVRMLIIAAAAIAFAQPVASGLIGGIARPRSIERTLILGRFPDEFGSARGEGSGPASDGASLAEVERRHILAVLREVGGNRDEAARRLGVSRKTIDRKCAAWNV